jgi:serpin B
MENTHFALDLYARLKEGPGNLFVSPFSVSTALAMTYAGARGRTAQEMADVLHFELPQERLHPIMGELVRALNVDTAPEGCQLSVANALWGQAGCRFLPSFLDLTVAHYGAGLHEVDFAGATEEARLTINRWVEEKTREKIVNLIPRGMLDPLARLVLTNAIYFKGAWQSPFNEKITRDAPFTLLDGGKVDAPMMHQTSKFGHFRGRGFQALDLPYAGKRLSMVILLPDDTDGLPELESSLTEANLTTWLAGIQQEEVVVAIPKFKMISQFELARDLAAMGMPTACSDAADFSGMTGARDLFISKVLHKTFVEVGEEGTEAAAATAVVMALTAAPAPREQILFRADHPFLFMIRDLHTGSILFLGRVMDPTTEPED